MRRVTIILAFIPLITNLIFAQPQAPDTLWTRTYGGNQDECGYSVQQTSDRGYIITGHTSSYGAGNKDIYLVKTDSSGYQQWFRTFGGTNQDYGRCVQQTSDGGYIVIGYTNSYGAGNYDVYLIKTDSLGNQIWARTFGSNMADMGYSVKQTSDGGYILIGTTCFGAGGADSYLIKTDDGGNMQWEHSFGGTGEEGSLDIEQTRDGGYIFVGYTSSFGAGLLDVYVVKTDNSGNQEWYRCFGGANDDTGTSVIQTADNCFVITGDTRSYSIYNHYRIFLLKIDSRGNHIWYNIYANDTMYSGHSTQQTIDGGYIIAGSNLIFGQNYNLYLLKTNTRGYQQWSKSVGGNYDESGWYVQQTDDDGFIVVGRKNYSLLGPYDVYLVKFESENLPSIMFDEPADSPFILLPSAFLLSASPNPFNNSTTISFALPASEEISLKVYDVSGREIQDLGFGIWDLGKHSVVWNAGDNASGIYFVRLDAGEYVKTQKLVLMK